MEKTMDAEATKNVHSVNDLRKIFSKQHKGITEKYVDLDIDLLNNFRKLTPEQRKEILDIIEIDETREKDALKKNPNLNLERQLNEMHTEIKYLRNELYSLINNGYKCKEINSNESIVSSSEDMSDNYEICSLFSIDFLPMWIFLLMLFISLLLPGKTHSTIRPLLI